MNIRAEQAGDAEDIRRVNLAAFETSTEAELVDALRREAAPIISLVAQDDVEVIGHVLFSPVTLTTEPSLTLMGLAPMAVIPSRQRQGVGSALVREGLDRCRRIGAVGLVVLGHAEFYPRFGFVPAGRLSLRCEYDVPEDIFMACELVEGALRGLSGVVRYHQVFRKF